MSVKDATLNTQPTSYWPLDDDALSCQDLMGLHNASLPTRGVTLAVIPFGAAQAPFELAQSSGGAPASGVISVMTTGYTRFSILISISKLSVFAYVP